MNANPAQVVLARRAVAVLYLLVFCATVGYSISQQMYAPVILMAVAMIGSWLLVDSPVIGRPLYPPRWLSNVVVLGGACLLFFDVSSDELGNQSLIVLLSRFILVLLACKLFERKTRRDISQSIILSLLVVVAGAMFSFSGLAFTSVFLAYLGTLFYFAAVIFLQGEFELVRTGEGFRSALPHNGRFRAMMYDLRAVSKIALLLATPIALVVFLFTPRTRSPSLMPAWTLTAGAQMGYTETVQFGETGTLTPSENIVMNVRLSRNGNILGSAYDEPYFRGQVLDEYNPDRDNWVRTYRPADINPTETGRANVNEGVLITLRSSSEQGLLWKEPVNVAGQSPEDPATPSTSQAADDLLTPRQPVFISPDDIRQDYQLLMQAGQTIFAIPTPVAIAGNPAELPTYRLVPQDMVLRSRAPTLPLYYTIYSRPGFLPSDAKAPQFVQPGLLRKSRQTRNGNILLEVNVSKEITRLAQSLVGEYLDADGSVARAEDVPEVVSSFERYLRANYPYSLELKRIDKKLDPTTDFLLNRKGTGGHCEYFASSMVMLCRAVGINSRVVAGFRGGDYSPMLQAYVVREKHAHAWAEVYMPGDGPDSGWTISDPTPGQVSLNSTPGTLQLWARDFVQFVQSTWTTLVVTFDEDSRRSLLASLQDWASGLADRLEGLVHAAQVGIWQGAAGAWTRWTLLGCITGIPVCLGYLVYALTTDRRQKQQWSSGRRPRPHSGDLAFLEDLLTSLERVSVPRQAFQTPSEFIEQSIARLGLAGGDARFLVATAYARRFGGNPLDGELKQRISEALARVKSAARGRQPKP